MTTDRETLHAIGLWLEEGRTVLPDHVLDAVLEQLPSKPQRRPAWAVRRISHMNPIAKYAIAAAAVVVIAIVGWNFVGTSGTTEPGGLPSITESPSPSAAPPSPAPLAPSTGSMEAGRYRWTSQGGDVSFDVPDGWTGGPGAISKNVDSQADVTLAHNLPGTTYEVTHVYSDACASENALEPIGATVDDLVAALEAQENVDVAVADVTAGSVVGKRIAIEQAASLADRSGCRHGPEGPLQIWADEAETGFFALAPGFSGIAYVFEVDGDRFVFSGAYGPEASDADIAELDAIIESMEFWPR